MISTKTKLAGLFGHPVSQSMSPLMFNTAFASEQIDMVYTAFDVHPEQLAEAVAGIRALGLVGVNVTIPHKVSIIPYLDEIDPLAQRIGAINVVVNKQGRLIGYNTDGMGYVRSLLDETGVQLSEQRVTMVGAGGAARAVACTLAEQGIKEIRIVNRSRERAEQLAEQLKSLVPVQVVDANGFEQAVAEATLLINTTSIGMYPNTEEIPVPAEWLHADLVVSDLIYNPLETKLLAEARKAGAKTHSGLGMFINQGALAYELWLGQPAPVQRMREEVLRQLQQM